MAKSTSRSRRQDGPVLFEHPLADVDRDALRAALIEDAKAKAKEFPQKSKRRASYSGGAHQRTFSQ